MPTGYTGPVKVLLCRLAAEPQHGDVAACCAREPAALTAPQEITQCLRDPDPTEDTTPPPLPPASSSSRSRHGGRPSGGSAVSGRASSPRTSVAGSEVSGVDAAAQRHRSADGATPRSGLASVVSNGRARSRASSQVCCVWFYDALIIIPTQA